MGNVNEITSFEELKLRIKEVPISHIIKNYIKLAPQGEAFLGLCPFHHDTNPSLRVNDRKGFFMCFACNTGGDAITFVQKLRSYNFIETVQEISNHLGLATDDLFIKGPKDQKSIEGRKFLSKTAQMYRQFALSNKFPIYIDFLKKRKLTTTTAETFKLGYAPNYNNLLSALLKENQQLLPLAEELGLIRSGLKDNQNNSKFYDTFRERIIFPIHDIFGEVIGFSSRAIYSYQKAKYLNSPESFLFNKRNVLFGAHLAKKSIRECDQVIIVEGHMDLITLHQFGVTNSVALMGVALNARSIGVLKFLTKNFVLALDSDQAGWKAIERINQELLKQQILAKFIDFAPYKDPDEFLNASSNSIQLLREKINNAAVILDKVILQNIPTSVPTLPEEKLTILKKIMSLVT
ncbi:MAG: DNA primase, partial [Oligoflexia bacterium]|nr:DNA primase [Oligoflexia bacterium]